jgi:predicted Abi (CAAX) family protease
LPEAQRQSTYDLIGALKRSIAEKPCLSFADVVAKLKTCDDLSRDGIGEKLDDLQKNMMRSALADRRRSPPAA